MEKVFEVLFSEKATTASAIDGAMCNARPFEGSVTNKS